MRERSSIDAGAGSRFARREGSTFWDRDYGSPRHSPDLSIQNIKVRQVSFTYLLSTYLAFYIDMGFATITYYFLGFDILNYVEDVSRAANYLSKNVSCSVSATI